MGNVPWNPKMSENIKKTMLVAFDQVKASNK